MVIVVSIWACSGSGTKSEITAEDESLMAKAKGLFQPLPENAEVDYNPTTSEKFELGYTLYYDKRLSKDGNISCNSCHNLTTFGVDNKPVSEGDDGSKGNRNSPTVLNAALHSAQFWDGRAKDVEEQAGMPVLNPVEMAIPHEGFIVDRLKAIELYKTMFTAAFPGEEDPISFENMAKAIGCFERQLLTPSSWDNYLKGEHLALTKEQKLGLQNFIDIGCATCHLGNNLGGNMFQKFGIHANYWDHTGSAAIDSGKISITKTASDLFVFKVPSMRNIAETYPYFHDGSVSDLGEAVKVMAVTQLGKELTDEQTKSIVAFLQALSGEVPEAFSSEPAVFAEHK